MANRFESDFQDKDPAVRRMHLESDTKDLSGLEAQGYTNEPQSFNRTSGNNSGMGGAGLLLGVICLGAFTFSPEGRIAYRAVDEFCQKVNKKFPIGGPWPDIKKLQQEREKAGVLKVEFTEQEKKRREEQAKNGASNELDIYKVREKFSSLISRNKYQITDDLLRLEGEPVSQKEINALMHYLESIKTYYKNDSNYKSDIYSKSILVGLATRDPNDGAIIDAYRNLLTKYYLSRGKRDSSASLANQTLEREAVEIYKRDFKTYVLPDSIWSAFQRVCGRHFVGFTALVRDNSGRRVNLEGLNLTIKESSEYNPILKRRSQYFMDRLATLPEPERRSSMETLFFNIEVAPTRDVVGGYSDVLIQYFAAEDLIE